MPMDEGRKEYLKQYKRENLKRIPLEIRWEMYSRVKIAAELEEMSVNRYIKWLIEGDLKKKEKRIDRLLYKQQEAIPAAGTPSDFFASTAVPSRLVRKIIQDPTGQGLMVVFVPEEESEKILQK